MNQGRARLGLAFMAVLGMLAAALGLWRPLPSGDATDDNAPTVEVISPAPAAGRAADPGDPPGAPRSPESVVVGTTRHDGAGGGDDAAAEPVTLDDAREQVRMFVEQLRERKALLDERYDATVAMLEQAGVPEDRIDAVEEVAAAMNGEIAVAQRDLLAELLVTRGVPMGAVNTYREQQALLEAEYSPQIVEALGDYADVVPSAALDGGRYLDVVVPELDDIDGW